ncbi:hypothetical protein [Thermovibrio ammonificans]|uniref:Uncharacterized protein n=1 Tax=Thermovibrio ammonificans (strain DSM 15698 / JCM 12110 / HB-1) TaxID=648996 RepID=E8T6D5_THEA1|nr:hypothetical protein [Thermovibrio ammonificans]ADU96719.1 hypothetical protein Theam_0752 [Thermovibrio ammonificans HB-1]
MKRLILGTLALCFAAAPVAAKADICACKPEAASKKEPLPVKVKRLKEENVRLQQKLAECKVEKDAVRAQIAQLQRQISQLEDEKVQLENRLRVLPSKEELEAQIEELQSKLGR